MYVKIPGSGKEQSKPGMKSKLIAQLQLSGSMTRR